MPKKSILKVRSWLVILAVTFALGAYLRLEPALFNFTHFSYDQAVEWILTKELVVDHRLSLISRFTGLSGVFMGPWFTWMLALPFAISGGHPGSGLIFQSLLSLGSALVTFLLFNRHFPAQVAAIASVMVILSAPFITASQIIFSPASITFFSVIYLWLTFQVVSGDSRLLVPLFLLTSFFFQFEIGYAIFTLFALIITLALFRPSVFVNSKRMLLSSLAFIVPFIPQILFEFRHDFLMTNSILSFIRGENQSLGSDTLTFAGRLQSRLGSLLEDTLFTLNLDSTAFYLLAIWLVSALVGWYFIHQDRQKSALLLGKLTLTLLLLHYLGYSLYTGPIWTWYRAGIPIFIITLIAIPLGKLYSLKSTPARLLTIALLAFFAFRSIRPFDRLEVAAGQIQTSVSTLSLQHQTLDSIYQDASGRPFALYVYTPPIYPFIWDYQLYWYAQNKYGYLPDPYDRLPQTNNPELVYLLVETVDEFPDRIDGWRGNFRAHGEVVETWPTGPGIQIEKWRLKTEPESSDPLIRFTNVFAGD